jgi:putative SOS response-associated peptidase YedK
MPTWCWANRSKLFCFSVTNVCGRYTQLLTWEQIVHLYELATGLDPPADFQPRYNIASNQMAPVMRMRDGKRELAMLQWGLIPHRPRTVQWVTA